MSFPFLNEYERAEHRRYINDQYGHFDSEDKKSKKIAGFIFCVGFIILLVYLVYKG